MQPTGKDLERLQQAILDAFTLTELRAVLRIQLDVDLERLIPVSDRNLTQIVESLVRVYAAQEGGLLRLTWAMLAERPRSAALQAMEADWRTAMFEPLPLPERFAETLLDQRGQQVGVQYNIAGDAIFAGFAEAPLPLARFIFVQKFKSLIRERTRGFVGRDFVFWAIDDFLAGVGHSSGYLVIRGEPGIGKSALLGELVNRRGYVHHFNVALQNVRSPRDFLGNICAQLIVRYKLKHSSLPPDALDNSLFLSQLMEEAVARPENTPLVVLVDALDEAEDIGLTDGANRLFLPPSLPDQVYFIVTAREEHDIRLRVDEREDIYLDDKSQQNLADVRTYIEGFILAHPGEMSAQIAQWGLGETDFVTTLTEKSQGNFMYLVYVLRDIRDGKLSAGNLGNIRKLPQGLKDYYRHHWRTMKGQDPVGCQRSFRPVLCMLATVREPVSVQQLAEYARLPVGEVLQVIRTWREFLNEDETGTGEPVYRIYHSSFADFLEAEEGLREFHSQLAQTVENKIPGLNEDTLPT